VVGEAATHKGVEVGEPPLPNRHPRVVHIVKRGHGVEVVGNGGGHAREVPAVDHRRCRPRRIVGGGGAPQGEEGADEVHVAPEQRRPQGGARHPKRHLHRRRDEAEDDRVEGQPREEAEEDGREARVREGGHRRGAAKVEEHEQQLEGFEARHAERRADVLPRRHDRRVDFGGGKQRG